MALYPLVPRAQDDVIFSAISMMSLCTLASTHTQETSQFEGFPTVEESISTMRVLT